MKGKCLVLGGDGFLGSHLVDDLLLRGFFVRAFDRFEDGKMRNLIYPQKGLEIFSGDFLNVEDIEEALQGIDTVFHFISLGNPVLTIKDPESDIKNNVLGTIRLLDACVKQGIKKVIYPSSGGAIYGNVKGDCMREDSFLEPITPYSINKLCIEKYLSYYKKYYGLDCVIYRISNPYGERQSADGTQGVIPILLKKVLNEEVIDVYGNSVRDYIYIKDVTNFIADNFDKNHKYEVYNLGSGRPTSLEEVLLAIEKVTCSTPKKNQLERREFDVARIVLDVDRVKEEFHFTPTTDFIDGVQKTFDYIRHSIEQHN